MSIVWDTGTLSLYFADNKELKEYMRKIVARKIKGYVPRLILAEFFYKTCQKLGREVAQVRLVALRQAPIIEEPLNEIDVFGVGMRKIKHPNLSLADCILIQLAKKYHATILTTENEITKTKDVKAKKISY